MNRLKAMACAAAVTAISVMAVGGCESTAAQSGAGEAQPVVLRDVAIELVGTPDGKPIAGAVVRSRPQNPKHVMRVSDYLRSPASPASVQTDASGRAVLRLPADRPFELVVAVPGRAPESISFDGAEELTDAARTFLLPVGGGGSGAAAGGAAWWGELRCGPAKGGG